MVMRTWFVSLLLIACGAVCSDALAAAQPAADEPDAVILDSGPEPFEDDGGETWCTGFPETIQAVASDCTASFFSHPSADNAVLRASRPPARAPPTYILD